uniref:Uncharacterized protein n=1 Tax=Timema tahoe TaxID=61484 RepID=A0A7R9IA74_9NEOP|nr:unnamed protein product [Timema tahoe]
MLHLILKSVRAGIRSDEHLRPQVVTHPPSWTNPVGPATRPSPLRRIPTFPGDDKDFADQCGKHRLQLFPQIRIIGHNVTIYTKPSHFRKMGVGGATNALITPKVQNISSPTLSGKHPYRYDPVVDNGQRILSRPSLHRVLLPVRVIRLSTNYANGLGFGKVEFTSELAFAWRESGKPFRGIPPPSSPERDSNLDLPILSILAQHETSALANYATEAGPKELGQCGHKLVLSPVEKHRGQVWNRAILRPTMNDMVVRSQSRLDGKWLKMDLQWAFNPDGLSQLWNEMVKDCELTGSFSDGLLNAVGIVAHKGESGHYYCGLRVLTCPCCDGICGPNTGCNCPACQRLDQEEAARTEVRGTTPLPSLPQIDSWTWGPQPSEYHGTLTGYVRWSVLPLERTLI